MLTPQQLIAKSDAVLASGMSTITQDDREQMALALLFHGYDAGDACHRAFVVLENNDGALQMLARHREASHAKATDADEREVRIILQAVADADSEDCIGSIDVDIPKGGYPRQWLREAARAAIAKATGAGA